MCRMYTRICQMEPPKLRDEAAQLHDEPKLLQESSMSL